MKFEKEYSVDMLKIRRRVYKDDIKSFMEQYSYQGDVKYYKNVSGLGKCRHNWSIEIDKDKSYWIGFNLITAKGGNNTKKAYLYLEYNPNKIPMEGKIKEIFYRFFRGRDFEIVSADIAVDLYNIDINTDVFIDKGAFRHYTEKQYSKNNRTYYIGKNKVKIYDKALEMGIDDKNITRYEIRIKPNITVDELDNYIYKGSTPGIYVINNFELDENLNDNHYFILKALVNNVGGIHELSRRYRKKIKSALDKQTKFKADSRKLSETLKKYIYDDLLANV